MLEKIKSAYLLWHQYHELISKTQKYSLGNKVDSIFIDIIEAISFAAFLKPEEKTPWLRLAIRKLETLKILIMILWESGSLLDKRYVALSEKLDEIGGDTGGWYGKMNSMNKK